MSEMGPENDGQGKSSWGFVLRVILKAAAIFVILNVLFAWLFPMEALGRLSLYNWLLPGRLRLPYGEQPAESYNLSLNNLPAMMASQAVAQPKAADEFRVIVIGDSGTWGWLLENEETLAGQLNELGLKTADGRRVVAYNLGYPIMALAKDLLLLDEAMALEPDLILWPVTLQSFPRDKQLIPPLVQANEERLRKLIAVYDLGLDPADELLREPTFWERTIVGQRRPLADLIRLQAYGFSWAATGIDQAIPAEYEPRATDFEVDVSWLDYDEPVPLDEQALAFDVLAAGITRAGETPVLLVNEPIYISQGRNSELRYNAWYPRWAYDAYRKLLGETVAAQGWHYIDLWDVIGGEEFTDSPVHLTPAGTSQVVERIAPTIMGLAGG